MSEPATSALPGTQLGDFVLEGLLGQGGGGTVYAARWGHRPVALKVLREDLLSDPSERRRFLDEAKLLAEVNHPGVVRILGYGALPDGRPYLAMERLEGESLAERVRRGPMEPEEALRLHAQLAQAAQALHDRGLVHRDIKPENVFLVQDGLHAVLLDFGIAKPLGAPASTVTRQGGVRGTPAYMAPERFFGAPASPATDIYELGVVLYAMLTGRLPWELSEDPVSRLSPLRPSAIGCSLPGRLEDALLSALSTRAENRPGSPAIFAAHLEEAMRQPGARPARRTADLEALGFCTTQATPSRAEVPFWGQTTRSRATGEHIPALPAPSTGLRQGLRPGLRQGLLGAGALALLLLAGGVTAMVALTRRTRPVGEQTPALLVPASLLEGHEFDRLAWGLHGADTFLFLRLRHEELQRSSMWETFSKGLAEHPGLALLARLEKRCGLDLLRETRWLSVGLAGSHAAPLVDAVLRGSWTRARIESCLQGFESGGSGESGESDARGEGSSKAVERLGQVSRVQLGGHFVYLAWPAEDTFMVSTRSAADPEWYRARLEHRTPLWTREAMLGAFESLDPDDTALLITTDADFQAHELLKGLPRPEALALTLRTRKDLLLRGVLSYSDPQRATSAEELLRSRLGSLLGENAVLELVLASKQVTRQGKRVEVSFQLTESTSRLVGVALASALKSASFSLPAGAPKP
ncbi:MAG: serine/threonine-protein kinase [Polyangia bacterium]|jgi:tRNA A-37 threonylcarbamoyl transferase component Bud32|nr:serine/threonine-protein kinase [Polyangia bacterium]